MNDLMIDLETLGTDSNCVVISIGAVFFDINTGRLGKEFYEVLNLKSQEEIGQNIDSDTFKWWMKQSSEAKQVFSVEGKNTKTVLENFVSFIHVFQSMNGTTVWGNGSSFDISILENLYKAYNLPVPWKYNKVNDLRTFERFVAKGAKIEKIGVAHNALDDAKNQANYVLKHASKI